MTDVLLQAAYTGPTSGTRIPFRYRQNLPVTIRKRLSERRYLYVNGIDYQDSGDDQGEYTIRAQFSGATHVQDALRFVTVCREPTSPGIPGILEHPREGIKEVQVISITTVHDPNEDAARTFVILTLHDKVILPENLQDSPSLAVTKALTDCNASIENDFVLNSILENIDDYAAMAGETVSVINVITETVGKVLNTSSNVLGTFDAIKQDIRNNISTIVNSPAILASQVVRMVQSVLLAPNSGNRNSSALIDCYKGILGIDSGANPTLTNSPPDRYTINRGAVQTLAASAAISAMYANSIVNSGQNKTRKQAYFLLNESVYSANEVTKSLDKIQSLYDAELFQNQFFPNTETYARLLRLRYLAISSVQLQTANLPATQIIENPRDETIFQICYDYYKRIDDNTLEVFIESNTLTPDEIEIVPKGRILEL